MNVIINGESRQCPSPLTLTVLLEQLSLKPDRVAVELNRAIVSRDLWKTTQLAEGDRLEIVHFVGGGWGPFVNASTQAISNTLVD